MSLINGHSMSFNELITIKWMWNSKRILKSGSYTSDHSWLQTDLAVSKIQMLSKDEDLPLLKMCLRLWRQFPKRSPKMCMAPYPLPASRLKPSSFSQTSSGSCFCQAPHHSLWRGKALWKACVYLASHFFMSLPLFRLWWYHWNNSWDSPKTKKRAW